MYQVRELTIPSVAFRCSRIPCARDRLVAIALMRRTAAPRRKRSSALAAGGARMQQGDVAGVALLEDAFLSSLGYVMAASHMRIVSLGDSHDGSGW